MVVIFSPFNFIPNFYLKKIQCFRANTGNLSSACGKLAILIKQTRELSLIRGSPKNPKRWSTQAASLARISGFLSVGVLPGHPLIRQCRNLMHCFFVYFSLLFISSAFIPTLHTFSKVMSICSKATHVLSDWRSCYKVLENSVAVVVAEVCCLSSVSFFVTHLKVRAYITWATEI